MAHVFFNRKNADLVHATGKAKKQGSENRGEDPGDISRMVCGTDGTQADGWYLESRPEMEEKGQEEKKQKKTGISIICLSLFQTVDKALLLQGFAIVGAAFLI